MKGLKYATGLAIILIAVFAFKGGEQYSTLEIGQKAPELDYSMQNIDKEFLSLNDLKGQKGTLVIFSCNTCPFVIAWEDRYPELKSISEDNQLGIVLVNSNEAKREGDDSINKMKDHAEEMGYSTIPYLVDSNSKLANAFGAKTTPHVFLFNSDWELVYEGAIDDNYKNAKEVKETFLKNAILNLAEGKEINPSTTKSLGCSIKRIKM